ncbi:MAG TPA: hypothetical protein VGG75_25985 [Trebonia sp.]|jgi:hypothetical protein
MEALGSGGGNADTEVVADESGNGAEEARDPAVINRIAGLRPVSPALQGLLALVAYLAVFVFVFAWPLVRELGTPTVSQTSQDPNFYVWCWQWWPYALTHGLNPLQSSQIGAPAGFNLAWVTPAAPVALVMWPVTAAFGPVASFNLTLIFLLPLSAWAAFVAARRLTGRFWASLLGGAVFAFNPYEVGHTLAGQVNLVALFPLPLMLYLTLLWRDGALRRTGFVWWLGAVMGLEFYVFSETFLMMTMMWAAALVVGLLITRGSDRRTVARLASLVGLAYAVALVLASPLVYYMLRHSPRTSWHLNTSFFVHPVGLILPQPGRAPTQWLSLLATRDVTHYSIVAYVGIPALILLAALVVLGRDKKLNWLVAILFAVAILLSFGSVLQYGPTTHVKSIPLPWGLFWYLPFVRNAQPERVTLFAYLALGIAVALWLAAPVRGGMARAGRWSLALLAVGMLCADLTTFSLVINDKPAIDANAAIVPAGSRLPEFITDGLYRQYLKPGEIVVIVSDRGNAGMLFQAASDFYFRLDGGYINASQMTSPTPAAVNALEYPTKAREQAFRSYARKNGVGAVIVEQSWAEPWMKVFGDIGLHGTSVGGVTLYPISQ